MAENDLYIQIMKAQREADQIRVLINPPHGCWNHGICSTCGFNWSAVAPTAAVPTYCPNCGTKNS